MWESLKKILQQINSVYTSLNVLSKIITQTHTHTHTHPHTHTHNTMMIFKISFVVTHGNDRKEVNIEILSSSEDNDTDML